MRAARTGNGGFVGLLFIRHGERVPTSRNEVTLGVLVLSDLPTDSPTANPPSQFQRPPLTSGALPRPHALGDRGNHEQGEGVSDVSLGLSAESSTTTITVDRGGSKTKSRCGTS